MSGNEAQSEEIEVLHSIYEGDDNFKKLAGDRPVFQYRIDDPGGNEHKNFLLEIGWGSEYPDAMPEVSLEAFFNNHVDANVKNEIREAILNQAEELIGCAMTYTLFEYAKENAASLMENQLEKPEVGQSDDVVKTVASSEKTVADAGVVEKSKLTKAQKRRLWDKMEAGAKGGEKPRGWDWVDIVKHLSQTGSKDGD